MGVGGEVEIGSKTIAQTIVGEHIVQTEVASVVRHIVNPRVGEVAEDVGIVQPRHRDFGNTHFQERAEGAKNPLFACFHPEPSSSGEVTTLHDARGDEDVRIGIVNLFQTAGAFEIAIDDLHFFHALGFAHPSEDGYSSIAEDVAVGIPFIAGTHEGVFILGCFDAFEVVGGGLLTMGFEIFDRQFDRNYVVSVGLTF